MEYWIAHLAHTIAWIFVVTSLFAFIGLVATIRWIIGIVTGAEKAVVSGAETVERDVERK